MPAARSWPRTRAPALPTWPSSPKASGGAVSAAIPASSAGPSPWGRARRDIVRLVLRDGIRLGLLGVGLGVIGALSAAGVLRGLLFEFAPRDPVSLAAVSALLLLATLTAAWLPARRASRVDPIKALRAE